MRDKFIPYGRQDINENDIASVVDLLKSDYLTTGPVTKQFEENLEKNFDSKYATACSSGTAGLHLAYLALGIGEGDVVIVPSITFVATANAARLCGADVVFSDVDPHTGLMELSYLEEAVARAKKQGLKPKAVSVVHLRGAVPDMAALHDFCQDNDLFLIEDACHAIGATYGPKKDKIGSCTYSDVTVFSFHPVKTIAMGEGGAVLTKHEDIDVKVKQLVSHGLTRSPDCFKNTDMAFDSATEQPNKWYYEQLLLGLNYRASDIHCALGSAQLKRLNSFSKIRKQHIQTYSKQLKGNQYIKLINDHSFGDHVYHLQTVHIDFEALGQTRDWVMNRLFEYNIGSQVHYIPVHRQPYYRELYGDKDLKGVNSYYKTCLSLPLHTKMTTNDVFYVTQTLKDICGTP